MDKSQTYYGKWGERQAQKATYGIIPIYDILKKRQNYDRIDEQVPRAGAQD